MVTEKNALQVLTSPVLWVVKVVAWKWFSDIKNLDHDLDPLMSFHATGLLLNLLKLPCFRV